ncbi:hypothetical protein D9M70_346270 [compost metagenome]
MRVEGQMLVPELDSAALQLRRFPLPADHVQQVGLAILALTPAFEDAVVVVLLRLLGGVRENLAVVEQRKLLVPLEPGALDDPATERARPLLVLAREDVRVRCTHLLEHFGSMLFGPQRNTILAERRQ